MGIAESRGKTRYDEVKSVFEWIVWDGGTICAELRANIGLYCVEV